MMVPLLPYPRYYLVLWSARPATDSCARKSLNHASVPPPPIEAALEGCTKELFPSRSSTTKIKGPNMPTANASGTSELPEAEL